MMMDGTGAGLVGFLIYAVLVVVPFYQLWKRTGHNGWIALRIIIPDRPAVPRRPQG